MEDIDESEFKEDPDFVDDKDEIYSDDDEYIVEEYLEACPVKRKHVQLTLSQKLEIIEVCTDFFVVRLIKMYFLAAGEKEYDNISNSSKI